jgi:hypothetical protein
MALARRGGTGVANCVKHPARITYCKLTSPLVVSSFANHAFNLISDHSIDGPNGLQHHREQRTENCAVARGRRDWISASMWDGLVHLLAVLFLRLWTTGTVVRSPVSAAREMQVGSI